MSSTSINASFDLDLLLDFICFYILIIFKPIEQGRGCKEDVGKVYPSKLPSCTKDYNET